MTEAEDFKLAARLLNARAGGLQARLGLSEIVLRRHQILLRDRFRLVQLSRPIKLGLGLGERRLGLPLAGLPLVVRGDGGIRISGLSIPTRGCPWATRSPSCAMTLTMRPAMGRSSFEVRFGLIMIFPGATTSSVGMFSERTASTRICFACGESEGMVMTSVFSLVGAVETLPEWRASRCGHSRRGATGLRSRCAGGEFELVERSVLQREPRDALFRFNARSRKHNQT